MKGRLDTQRPLMKSQFSSGDYIKISGCPSPPKNYLTLFSKNCRMHFVKSLFYSTILIAQAFGALAAFNSADPLEDAGE